MPPGHHGNSVRKVEDVAAERYRVTSQFLTSPMIPRNMMVTNQSSCRRKWSELVGQPKTDFAVVAVLFLIVEVQQLESPRNRKGPYVVQQSSPDQMALFLDTQPQFGCEILSDDRYLCVMAGQDRTDRVNRSG